MRPEVVTFDCAQTLVKVDWRPGEFAVRCARHVGLDLDEAAADLYMALYGMRRSEYVEINLTRDPSKCLDFWRRLGIDWLQELGLPSDWYPRIDEASKQLGFGRDSTVFSLYPDVVPCLDRLQALGIRAAVISNWDYSLHPILQNLGVYDRFEVVIASLEEGFEKPDPRIFQLALAKLGVTAEQAAHVGDDALDDLKGARDVGMRALLIDRALKDPPNPPYISSLTQLPEALGWTD